MLLNAIFLLLGALGSMGAMYLTFGRTLSEVKGKLDIILGLVAEIGKHRDKLTELKLASEKSKTDLNFAHQKLRELEQWKQKTSA